MFLPSIRLMLGILQKLDPRQTLLNIQLHTLFNVFLIPDIQLKSPKPSPKLASLHPILELSRSRRRAPPTKETPKLAD